MVMSITAEAAKQAGVDVGDTLPAFAWPGGYPVFYMDAGNNMLCVKCANENDDFTNDIVACDVNWEDANLTCDHCSETIESAYAD